MLKNRLQAAVKQNLPEAALKGLIVRKDFAHHMLMSTVHSKSIVQKKDVYVEQKQACNDWHRFQCEQSSSTLQIQSLQSRWLRLKHRPTMTPRLASVVSTHSTSRS